MKTQGKTRKQKYAPRLVYYCAPEENDSLKPFFITAAAHPSNDNRKRNEIGNSVLQLLSYTHLYYYIPHTHTHSSLSRSLPHTKFHWGKV